VITSNGEREFPAPFMRRALTISMPDPDPAMLADMVAAHFNDVDAEVSAELVRLFVEHRARKTLAMDQLLNAVHLAATGALPRSVPMPPRDREHWESLLDRVWHRLETGQ
jgi:MoxR-like ATPase